MVAKSSGSVIIHSMMKTQTMANQIIPADQVGTVVYNQLVASVEKTMEGASQEEKNLALYHILEAMSRSWFH